MPAIIDQPPKKRRFLGDLRKTASFYTGGDIPPEPMVPAEAIAAPVAAAAGAGGAVEDVAALKSRIAELEAAAEKNRVAGEAAGSTGNVPTVVKAVKKGAKKATALAAPGEVPAMPPKPVAAPKATTAPAPKAAPTATQIRQARLQAQMDAAAEAMTGGEAKAVAAQRAAIAQKAAALLNAPETPATDLLRTTAPAPGAATAEDAAGTGTSRIRAKLLGKSGTVSEILSEAYGGPGIARAGRAATRIAKSPVAKGILGGIGYGVRKLPVVGESIGLYSDITRGHGPDAEGKEGIYEPSPEEYSYATKGADSAVGAPLFTMTDTEIPFLGKTRIPGGVIPDAIYKMGLGPVGQAMAVGRDIIKAPVHLYKGLAASAAAEKERLGSKAKYGTEAKATATRKAMVPITKARDAEKERQAALAAHLEELKQMYPDMDLNEEAQ